VVLQPGAEPFLVTLRAATYAVEWYSLADRQTCQAGTMVVASETRVSFTSPFPAGGPCVLYVQRTELG
jgi:hypothetical protein